MYRFTTTDDPSQALDLITTSPPSEQLLLESWSQQIVDYSWFDFSPQTSGACPRGDSGVVVSSCDTAGYQPIGTEISAGDRNADWDISMALWNIEGYAEDFTFNMRSPGSVPGPSEDSSIDRGLSLPQGSFAKDFSDPDEGAYDANSQNRTIQHYLASPSNPSTLDTTGPPSCSGSISGERTRNSSPSRIHSIETPQINTSSGPQKLRISPVRQPRISGQVSSRLYGCQECDRSFTLQKDVQRHLDSVHTRKNPYLCPILSCKYSAQGFSRKDKLLQHTRTHDATEQSVRKRSLSEASQDLEEDMTSNELKGVDADAISKPRDRQDSPVSQSDFDLRPPTILEPKMFVCSVVECGKSFIYQHDLARHRRTVHIDQSAGEGYRCASAGCAKADKIYPRLDSFKKHLDNKHKSENFADLLRKSTRVHEINASFPFAVTTPDMFIHKRPAEISIASHPAQKLRQSQNSTS